MNYRLKASFLPVLCSCNEYSLAFIPSPVSEMHIILKVTGWHVWPSFSLIHPHIRSFNTPHLITEQIGQILQRKKGKTICQLYITSSHSSRLENKILTKQGGKFSYETTPQYTIIFKNKRTKIAPENTNQPYFGKNWHLRTTNSQINLHAIACTNYQRLIRFTGLVRVFKLLMPILSCSLLHNIILGLYTVESLHLPSPYFHISFLSTTSLKGWALIELTDRSPSLSQNRFRSRYTSQLEENHLALPGVIVS